MTFRAAFLIVLFFAAGIAATVLFAIARPNANVVPTVLPQSETQATSSSSVSATSTKATTTLEKQTQPAANAKPSTSAPKPSVKPTAPSTPALGTAPTSAPAIAPTPKPAPVEPQPPAIIVVATSTQSAPAPDTSGAALSAAGIFSLTNAERVKAGLPPLAYNAKLEASAGAKNADMIAKQYFAHVSPEGVGIGDLAERFGYPFRHVGENLALGDFTSNTHVVNGWMDSPGHRANILAEKFTEIGISAVRGNYQGREVWYAVQEFGTPLPDCPAPSPAMRTEIETLEPQTDELSATLAAMRADIASTTDSAEYNKKADEYNALVDLYNTLIARLRTLITTYNAEVNAYNVCVGFS